MTEEELKGYLLLLGLKEIHEKKKPYKWIMSNDEIHVIAHDRNYEISMAGMIICTGDEYEIFKTIQEVLK